MAEPNMTEVEVTHDNIDKHYDHLSHLQDMEALVRGKIDALVARSKKAMTKKEREAYSVLIRSKQTELATWLKKREPYEVKLRDWREANGVAKPMKWCPGQRSVEQRIDGWMTGVREGAMVPEREERGRERLAITSRGRREPRDEECEDDDDDYPVPEWWSDEDSA